MTLRPIMAALVLAFAMLVPASAKAAGVYEPDIVKLTDGRELEGTIVKEQNGYIWLDMGVGQPLFLSPDKIEEIIRDSDEPLPTEVAAKEEKTWEHVPGVTRAAVITAEGMVGMQMSSTPLREAIPMLKEEGVDLVVFKVKSGGGYLLEIQQLSDVLHNEYKKEFQLVAWIDSAISAAAMTALTIEEIYFMPHGHFGAMTGWSGQLEAVEHDAQGGGQRHGEQHARDAPQHAPEGQGRQHGDRVQLELLAHQLGLDGRVLQNGEDLRTRQPPGLCPDDQGHAALGAGFVRHR